MFFSKLLKLFNFFLHFFKINKFSIRNPTTVFIKIRSFFFIHQLFNKVFLPFSFSKKLLLLFVILWNILDFIFYSNFEYIFTHFLFSIYFGFSFIFLVLFFFFNKLFFFRQILCVSLSYSAPSLSSSRIRFW